MGLLFKIFTLHLIVGPTLGEGPINQLECALCSYLQVLTMLKIKTTTKPIIALASWKVEDIVEKISVGNGHANVIPRDWASSTKLFKWKSKTQTWKEGSSQLSIKKNSAEALLLVTWQLSTRSLDPRLESTLLTPIWDEMERDEAYHYLLGRSLNTFDTSPKIFIPFC